MKIAVTTFARASIPTKGHEVLFEYIKQVAKTENADPLIFLSYKQDSKKNPVDYNTKVAFLTSCGVSSIITNSQVTDIFSVLRYCKDNNYDKVIFVVGSDRVDEITKRVSHYLGKTDETGLPFEFEVRCAGNRSENNEVSGISGTKMRQFVLNNDFESFKKWLPNGATNGATELWYAARKGMNLQ